MKKFVVLLLALCMALALTSAMADGVIDTQKCPVTGATHDWSHGYYDEAEYKAPTCHTAGQKTWVCTACQERVYVTIPATSGKTETKSTPATCQADGKVETLCAECKTVLKTDKIDKVAHNFVQDHEIEANCCNPGGYLQICTMCKTEQQKITIDAYGHADPNSYKWVHTAPTCTEKGSDVAICNTTGKILNTVEIPANGHNFDPAKHVVVNATCTTPGYTEDYCTNKTSAGKDCGKIVTTGAPALGHNFDRNWDGVVDEKDHVTTKATCTKTGKVELRCRNNCGTTSLIKELPLEKHNFVVDATQSFPAGCTQEGLKVSYCQNAGCVMKLTEVLEAKGHRTETHVIPATCVTEGAEEVYCPDCQLTFSSKVLPKLDTHKVVTDKVTKKATCTTDGARDVKCEVPGCTWTEKNVVIPARSHKMSELRIDEVTCTEDGHEYKYCLNNKASDLYDACTYSEMLKVTPALGHDKVCNKDLPYHHQEPTCYATGWCQWICTRCKTTDNDTLATTPHDLVTVISQNTATKHQVKTVYCKVNECNYTKTEEFCTPTEWKAVKPATCTEEGEQQRNTCNVPGCTKNKVETKKIDKVAHTEVVIPGKAATCTKDGLTDGAKCSVCNKVVKEQEVIKALGHKEVEIPAVAATCTKTGLTAGTKCSVCNEILTAQKEVAALGHKAGEWTIVKEATCDKDGEKVQKCTVCDTVVATEKIPATGHTAGEWTVAIEPTCTEKGLEESNCTVCGEFIDYRDIPALGHKAGAAVTTKEATCTEKGEQTVKCTVCDAVVETKEIAALGHKAGAAVTTKEATCTEKGEQTVKCTVCDAVVETKEVAALGHTAGEWVVDVEATCTTDGEQNKFCTVCGECLETETLKATGHQWGLADMTKSVCIEDGILLYICNNCGARYEKSLGAAVKAEAIYENVAEENVFSMIIDLKSYDELKAENKERVHFVVGDIVVCIPLDALTIDATTSYQFTITDGVLTVATIVGDVVTDITEAAAELGIMIEK